jgi:16S rRNA (cytidine1402-2'-O)-methyltransferase
MSEQAVASEEHTLPRGTLILVGTPIGNLSDLSPRATETLAQADLIAAEDTRRTRQLLSYLGLHQPLISYHEHNQAARGGELMEKLRAGQTIALVSDAGMPCISDPGARLVAECVAAGLPVLVIPGPCAAITALAGSGLETDRYAFEGFLPAESKLRKTRLAELRQEPRTVVLYEAPHRLKRTLQELIAAGLGSRLATLGRELTKKHEEFLRGTVQSLADYYVSNEPRGEFVIVLEGASAFARRLPAPVQQPAPSPAAASAAGDPETLLADLLASGLPVREAVRQVVRQTGRSRNELYALALKIQEQA